MVLRFPSVEMEGEISPDRDLFASEISVTLPETGSQLTPKNSHGDSDSFQESNTFKGSFSMFLKSRRAWVSMVSDKEGGKTTKNKIETRERDRREKKSGCSAIVEFLMIN